MKDQDIDHLEDASARINRMTIEEMLSELNITTTRHTYLYIDTTGLLRSTEKPSRDTYPADEAQHIGYAQKFEHVKEFTS